MPHRLTTFDDLHVGRRATFAKSITEADLSHFVAITGDTITAIFEVESIDGTANRIEMASWIETRRGETVIRGRTVASLIRQPDG